MTLRYGEVEKAARVLNVTIEPFAVRGSEDIDAALSTMTREDANALFLVADSLTIANRKRIIDFAAAQRIPAMYEFSLLRPGWRSDVIWPKHGRIVSSGCALYVDRIFKGAKPSELPVELPTKYEFVIDLKTANALGLTMSQPILLRADRVIQ